MANFNGTEGGIIKITDAATLTSNYRTENPTATKGHFFGKKLLREILRQRGCIGIRIYYGIETTTNAKKLVIAGVAKNGNDLLDLVLDRSMPCPDQCGSNNQLNSSL